MRSHVPMLCGIIAIGLLGAAPASAAGWSCSGPEVACSASPGSNLGASDVKHAKHKAHVEEASDDAAPVHAKRHHAKAVAANGDDAPRTARHRHTARAERNSGGSSYQSGVASYYHEPQRLASGGWFNPNAMTAAHRTLPFGTKVRVTHSGSGRSVVVTINDRGPYIGGRIIDLSAAAAGAIGMKGSGVAHVDVAVLGR